jgi:hypothetical protein
VFEGVTLEYVDLGEPTLRVTGLRRRPVELLFGRRPRDGQRPGPRVGARPPSVRRGEALALLGLPEREGGALRALRDLARGAGGRDHLNL